MSQPLIKEGDGGAFLSVLFSLADTLPQKDLLLPFGETTVQLKDTTFVAQRNFRKKEDGGIFAWVDKENFTNWFLSGRGKVEEFEALDLERKIQIAELRTNCSSPELLAALALIPKCAGPMMLAEIHAIAAAEFASMDGREYTRDNPSSIFLTLDQTNRPRLVTLSRQYMSNNGLWISAQSVEHDITWGAQNYVYFH